MIDSIYWISLLLAALSILTMFFAMRKIVKQTQETKATESSDWFWRHVSELTAAIDDQHASEIENGVRWYLDRHINMAMTRAQTLTDVTNYIEQRLKPYRSPPVVRVVNQMLVNWDAIKTQLNPHDQRLALTMLQSEFDAKTMRTAA